VPLPPPREAADAALAHFCAAPDAAALAEPRLAAAVARLARRAPPLQAALAQLGLPDEINALAGISPPTPLPDPAADLQAAVHAGLSHVEAGAALPAPWAAALEAAAQGDLRWWVPAARLHHAASPARVRASRMALSEQDLPYVFPGDLHPLLVDALASADVVFTALHVDWMRKLAGWMADALPADQEALGLWFWPITSFLDDRALLAALRKAAASRRGPPGARGLAFAVAARAGVALPPPPGGLGPADLLLLGAALAADRRR
jgi:hypothetical protein